jgi:hypothetical protein
MLTKQQSNELVLFLERYYKFYQEFLDLERKKYEAITQNDLKALDHFVTTEQAFHLKSRGFENERLQLLQACGESQTTFRNLIPKLDEEYQPKAKKIFQDLSDVLLDLKHVNKNCNSLAELRLHRINTTMNQIEKQPELQKAYNQEAQMSKKGSHVISKKI